MLSNFNHYLEEIPSLSVTQVGAIVFAMKPLYSLAIIATLLLAACGNDEDSLATCSKELACEDSEEFCRYDLEDQCGDEGETGKCVRPPEAIPTIYSPVCGCDGKTYGNETEAWGSETSVRSEGECE